MLLLILADRHIVGSVNKYIGSLQHGIVQQSDIDVIRVFANLLLERRRALQLTDISVHAQQQAQLSGLRKVALDIYSRHLGVQSRSQIFRQHVTDILVQLRRIGMCRQSMVIGHKKIASRLVLHLHKVLKRTEIVTQMELPCWAYAAKNGFHIFHIARV